MYKSVKGMNNKHASIQAVFTLMKKIIEKVSVVKILPLIL